MHVKILSLYINAFNHQNMQILIRYPKQIHPIPSINKHQPFCTYKERPRLKLAPAYHPLLSTEPRLELLFSPDNATVEAGQTIILSCEATGDPEPLLRWLHDGMVLEEDVEGAIVEGGDLLDVTDAEGAIQFIVEGGDLTLLDVTDAYEGLYECVFNNGFLETSGSAMITVEPGNKE